MELHSKEAEQGVLEEDLKRVMDEAASEIPLHVLPEPDLDLDLPPVPPRRPPRTLLSLILGSFGAAGLIAVGLLSLIKSDEPSATTQIVTTTTTTPAVGLSTQTTIPEESQAAVVDEPQTVVGDAPQAVVADTADYVTITDWTVLADLNGDGWIVATPAAPWLPGPDTDTAFGLIVGIGIDLGYQTNTSWWTLYDGTTRGESSIVGDDVRAALGGEVWVTSDGDLAVKLPGTSPTAGLSVTDLGPDAAIYLYGQLWPEEDSEAQTWEETRPLGPVTQVTDPLPLPDWLRQQLDFYEPITLIIPAG